MPELWQNIRTFFQRFSRGKIRKFLQKFPLQKLQKLFLLFSCLSLLGSAIHLALAIYKGKSAAYLDSFLLLLAAFLFFLMQAALVSRYRCPQCKTVFRPDFKREFLQGNLLLQRRLTCPNCGRFGLCHIVPDDEKDKGEIPIARQGKKKDEEERWKKRRAQQSGLQEQKTDGPEENAPALSSLDAAQTEPSKSLSQKEQVKAQDFSL